MKRLIPIGVLAACLTPAAVALAAQPSPSALTLTTTATSTKGKGSAQKPVGVGVGHKTSAATGDGSRPESWSEIRTSWGGVVSNGAKFPTCTVDQIDAVQSDADCPKGSLIGTGDLSAVVGPENDFSAAGAPCEKDVHVYNAGKNKATFILVGDAADCVGVGYLPPFPAKWVKAGGIDGGQTLVTPIPSNVSHPLPGILGSTTVLNLELKKVSVNVKGAKQFYLTSVGCKGTRKFTQVVAGDPSATKYTSKGAAGAC